MADEDEDERLDRELIELLNELRVALPGVQVMFAFLLTVPFTSRFARVTDLQQDAYLVALVATAIGSVLFIAPTSYHRIRWRDRDKEALLRTANRLAIAGTVLLAIAITSAGLPHHRPPVQEHADDPRDRARRRLHRLVLVRPAADAEGTRLAGAAGATRSRVSSSNPAPAKTAPARNAPP